MSSDLSEMIGGRVRAVRRSRGLSIEQLAEMCTSVDAGDLTVPALYSIETGRPQHGRRTRRVTVDEWAALSRALDVDPGYLLTLPGGQRTPSAAERLRALADELEGRV